MLRNNINYISDNTRNFRVLDQALSKARVSVEEFKCVLEKGGIYNHRFEVPLYRFLKKLGFEKYEK